MSDEERWRRCNACKNGIAFGATYWVCNVSTCNRKRTGLAFCSVSCWEVHLPMVNHRESWALEERAPSKAEAEREARIEADSSRARGKNGAGTATSAPTKTAPTRRREATPAKRKVDGSREILIVASRLKSYIRERSGFNTSDAALRPLSDFVRRACEDGIRNADRDERQTVMGRDIPRK